MLEDELRNEIKELIISSLELEDIAPSDIQDDEALFVDGLGLDSIDALELGMALKKKYGLKIGNTKEDNKKHFYSVNTLAEFIRSQKGE
ncbi:acyl carrier protein [Candidatus Gastranaerophilus sp. (ex Termes propinquus)]|nr:acyl carrier protein [Candidatus Gastranaerophilus sp. (ex Termes propinquus)]